MRRVREVLRLRTAGVGLNEIARRVGVAPSTVRLTLTRLASAGLGWPLPAEMTDAALEAARFAAVGTKQGHRRHVEPDWAKIHGELKRKHVTLAMLWDEYIERHPVGYRYSRFCELYRGWVSRLSVTMRQAHAGGDKLFVDYAGDTIPVIVDRLTGGSPGADFRRRPWAPPTSPTPRRLACTRYLSETAGAFLLQKSLLSQRFQKLNVSGWIAIRLRRRDRGGRAKPTADSPSIRSVDRGAVAGFEAGSNSR
jgi:hypothetical protein